MDRLLHKRLVDFTGEDLLELLSIYLRQSNPEKVSSDSVSQFVYGRAGIAQLFGCSKTTASRIKKSGIIDKAIRQCGRIIIVDAPKALELAGKKVCQNKGSIKTSKNKKG